MGGISGKVSTSSAAGIPRALIEQMNEAMAHRGRGGAGAYAPGAVVGLGQLQADAETPRRPARPAANEGETIWIAADASIYNARDLRAELRARGHVFRTDSDAEIIAHGYEQWGDPVVERLRGAFAFALWDASEPRLLLARDRFGIKPLFYSAGQDGTVVFASEIRAVLCDPDVGTDWNIDAIRTYLIFNHVLSPATLFKSIVHLPPAHLLVAQRGRVRVTEYWDLAFGGGADRRTERSYVEELGALARDAVRAAAADREPVTLLTGGPASTVVAHALSVASPKPVVTATAAIEGVRSDDPARARAVARALGGHHHTRTIVPRLRDLVPRLAWHFDTPLGDPSAVMTYYAAAAASEHGRLALSGHGGAELFGALSRHRLQAREERARRWLGPVAGPAGWLGWALPLGVPGVVGLRRVGTPVPEACGWKFADGLVHTVHQRALLTPEFVGDTGPSDPFSCFRTLFERAAALDPIDRVVYVETKTALADNLLVAIDRMSVATSCEVRLPLLDHRLAEAVARMPARLKGRGPRGGYLLHALAASVPGFAGNGAGMQIGRVVGAAYDWLRERTPVHPAALWLRGPLAPVVSDVLLSGRFRQRGVFRHKAVTKMWQQHLAGHHDYHRQLWPMLILELWFEQCGSVARHVARAA